jgi:hypothetical protein
LRIFGSAAEEGIERAAIGGAGEFTFSTSRQVDKSWQNIGK